MQIIYPGCSCGHCAHPLDGCRHRPVARDHLPATAASISTHISDSPTTNSITNNAVATWFLLYIQCYPQN